MICLYAPVQLCSLFPFLCVSLFAFQMSRFREFTPSVMPSLVHVALLFPVDVHLGTQFFPFSVSLQFPCCFLHCLFAVSCCVFLGVQFYLLSCRGPFPACPRCAPPDREPHNCLQVVDYRLHLALLAHLDRTGAVLVQGNLPRRTSRRRLPNRKCLLFYKNSHLLILSLQNMWRGGHLFLCRRHLSLFSIGDHTFMMIE